MALTDNLVAFWELDDLVDAHGANDLTNNNSATFATGKVGNAVDVERGSTQFLSRADNTDLSTGDIDWTLNAWVKVEAVDGSNNLVFVAKDDSGNHAEYYLFYQGSSSQFRLEVYGATGFGSQGAVNATTFGSVSTGTWYMVTAWHDATNNQVGIAVNAGTADTAGHSAGVIDGNGSFKIGADAFAADYFDGLIDQVGLWKRVLTSGERTSLYNSGNGLSYAAMSGGGATATPAQAALVLSGQGTSLNHTLSMPDEMVYGPRLGQTQPGGSTTITAGSTSAQIQTAVTAAAAGTTFWFPAGTYPFTSSVTPKSNQIFVGEYGAIFDGSTWTTEDLDDAFFRSIDNGVTGVTIKNLVLRDGPEYGVNSYLTAANWTVEFCEISGNRNGVAVGTGGVIRRNWIHHNVGISDPNPALRGGGIILANCAGAQVIYNEVSYNGSEQKFGDLGTELNHDLYVAYNFYHHNQGNGIWNDGYGSGTIIEYNTVEDNGAAGIDIEYSTGITVRNNTVRRQSGGEGIYVTVSKNITVTGNLLENNLFGVGLFLDFVSMPPNSADASWHQDLADNTISGNTIHLGSGNYLGILTLSNKGLGGTDPTPYETNAKNNDWASNTYFAPNTTSSWFHWDGVNKTFTTWQALPQDSGASITAE